MAYVAGLVQATSGDRAGRAGAEEPAGAGAGEDSSAAPSPQGAGLASLVRQWLRTSEDVGRHATERARQEAASRAHVAPEQVREEPELPRRQHRPVPPSRRLAVLIDAATTPSAHVDALFDLLGDAGRISVCRAYADWTVPTSQAWRARLRSHGIQPEHQFGFQGDQRALVAMTVDAVDLARESAVEAVALVGDLGSAHPLVARLNASGLAVIGLGPTDTPYDVRALCEEFVDLAFLDAHRSRGRHRA